MFISTHLCSKSEVINFLCAQKDSDLNSFDIVGKLFNLSHPLDMVAQVKLKKILCNGLSFHNQCQSQAGPVLTQ